MPLDLTTREDNGAALTAEQNDTNLTDIETAVNQLQVDATALGTDKLNVTDFNAFFEGDDSGKKQVDWARVINKPVAVTIPCLFRAVKTDSDQTIAAPGSITVSFSTESYDIGDNFSGVFTAPTDGIYEFGASVQVELDSGSPTDISILASYLVNATAQDQVTLDNSGTGTRIYKVPMQIELEEGDEVSFYVDFNWTGVAVWKVAANNTAIWGNRLHAL